MSIERISEEGLARLAELLRALAHDLRLRLIDALRVRGELSVGELEAETGIAQPTLSQQLAILRKADLVRTRKAAKQVYYSIAPEAFAQVAGFLGGLAATDESSAAPTASSKNRGAAAMFARLL
ncbi:MAG: helix-turn-helix transcriptional regulator [Sphingomonadales bacterium]|nr:helix-turn-helix transcriptional regulator [Sphingomonadales bacterium]